MNMQNFVERNAAKLVAGFALASLGGAVIAKTPDLISDQPAYALAGGGDDDNQNTYFARSKYVRGLGQGGDLEALADKVRSEYINDGNKVRLRFVEHMLVFWQAANDEVAQLDHVPNSTFPGLDNPRIKNYALSLRNKPQDLSDFFSAASFAEIIWKARFEKGVPSFLGKNSLREYHDRVEVCSLPYVIDIMQKRDVSVTKDMQDNSKILFSYFNKGKQDKLINDVARIPSENPCWALAADFCRMIKSSALVRTQQPIVP